MSQVRININAFIKAVDKNYSSNFINEGEIYLNTISWFREYEKQDSNIGDSFENVELACARGMSMHIKPVDKDVPFTKVTDNLQNFKVYKNNVKACLFCLYSVLERDSLLLENGIYENNIEPDFIKEYSDREFFIITNPSNFLDRTIQELQKHENVVSFEYGMVNYYPFNEEPKRTTSFDKRDKYIYQKEFRFFITLKKDEPLLLRLGDLNDIAINFKPKDHHKIFFNLG